MKQVFTMLLLFLASGILSAQNNFNLEMLNNTPVGEDGNDIWGYVDGNGTEYAIMGSRTNTWIWSLEDPANPILRDQIPGDASTWRDIKSWEDHLYVTTDSGNDGLLIIDMSMAPDSIRSHYITPPIISPADTVQLGPCHNLYIDENGFCYLAGCRISFGNKAIIFDLNQDKWNPPVVGVHSRVPGGGDYAHDLYVKNNIMYASEINQGQLGIYDCTRKDSLITLGTENTGFNFTHNAWSSTDQNYVFTTDERANAFVESYDVSDPGNITFLDRFQPLETVGEGLIPHNTHYYDGYLVTSFYTDGVVITDASKPDNLIKVGSYDTYLGPHGGFEGCWGAYPYLPSGLLLASDINTGLYIFRPSYVRAAFLEGNVTDAADGAAINNARIVIEADQFNYDNSLADGTYKTGIAEQGLFTVTATHPDYKDFSTEVEIVNGEVTILDIEMERIPLATVNINVVSASTGEAIPNAVVNIGDLSDALEYTTDDSGQLIETIQARIYLLSVGQWGYKVNSQVVDLTAITEYTIALEEGYEDNFAIDQGWTVESTASTGRWERAVPNGTSFQQQLLAPGDDSPFDNDTRCYVTGNSTGGQAADNDIDNGYTQLFSPSFDVAGADEVTLRFAYWYSTAGGNGSASDDTLIVYLHEQGDTIEIARFSEYTNGWSDIQEIDLTDHIVEGTDLRVSFYASDLPQSGHIVEAGIDNVSITTSFLSSTSDIDLDAFEVMPNPTSGIFNVEFAESAMRKLQVFNELGQIVLEQKTEGRRTEMNISHLDSGMYMLYIQGSDGEMNIQKIIKN